MASTPSTNSISSQFLSSKPCLGSHRASKPERASRTIMRGSGKGAHGGDYHYGGRLVDENLIVLRRRIHEMKMVERNYEPPDNWMDWEKNCYAGYDEFICGAVAALQSRLMDTRPGLALGVAALVALSVPTSVAVVLCRLAEFGNGVLGSVHKG